MIHRFTQNGINLVVDTNSGAVHILDTLCYQLLSFISAPMSDICPDAALDRLERNFEKSDICVAYSELYALYKAGQLFSDDNYIDFSKTDMSRSPIKSMCLHVSHDCNLRCSYCFASTGDFGTGRTLMTADTARKAIDFIIQKSQNRYNIEVDFFGGEPLMAMDTVRETVAYARSREKECGKNFRFTITTNGVLLNQETIEFINAEMSNVVLSLDGRRETNDRMRRTVSGQGSFDLIVPKFKRLVAQRDGRLDYFVRGTYTACNREFLDDVVAIADEGFYSLSLEPVVTKDPRLALSEEDLPLLFSEYERLAEEILTRRKRGEGFLFFHFMVDLAQGPCVYKRLKSCGAGYEYIAVTPDGDIYPCHQFVGNEEFLLGSLNEGITHPEIVADFAKSNIYTRPACADCWAKFYCSGGCAASNYTMCGDIEHSYRLGCELQKKRIECALYIKAREAVDAG